MSTKHKGSCLCGRVSYELSGDFQAFFLCHCSRCRKDSGSAHAANLFAQGGILKWKCGESEVKTYQYPDSLHAKSFCQHCGSALPLVVESYHCVMVPAGSLDSPVPISPTAKIFMADCAEWATDLSGVTRFDQMPGK